MNMYDIIYKKREGFPLTEEEIRFFIAGVADGSIPDYQTSALLMAIFFQDMNGDEISILTDAMCRSGAVMDLQAVKGVKVDKHSTGGVGDKTTLIAGPIAASAGVPVAKMSGRGLGFSGGTVDKLESIPGFQTSLSPDQFIDQVNRIGISVIGQTAKIASADKKLYALRDVTATVENIGLIASSIMSKKLASGSDAIVLDVKWGRGAFMKDLPRAEALAKRMVEIGSRAGKKTVALITDMNQPLGQAVGNSLEISEVIQVLKGQGPEDLLELSLDLAAYMIYCGEKAKTPREGKALAEEALHQGKALDTFRLLLEAQGGDPSIIEEPERLPQPRVRLPVRAAEKGFVTSIDARLVGSASQHCGAGRQKKEDCIDLSAGILLNKKEGDPVKPGDLLATVCCSQEAKAVQALQLVSEAYRIGGTPPDNRPLLQGVVEKI